MFRWVELRFFNIEGCGVPESAMVAVLRALRYGEGLAHLDISANIVKGEETARCVAGEISAARRSLKRKWFASLY